MKNDTPYQAHWLMDFELANEDDELLLDHTGFDVLTDEGGIIWSTGETSRKGDIQVFAFSNELSGLNDMLKQVGVTEVTELVKDLVQDIEDHPALDTIHSLWRLASDPDPKFGQVEWPLQAEFELAVKLKTPVPKSELIKKELLNPKYPKWPMNRRGKLYKTESEIESLAQLLSKFNSNQEGQIRKALGW